ncbi:hypothetical protein OM076_28715 [Solirubrobacter ginsenosidimutans]|uniref:Uncharacterized protein n=1 Tax=Solirubrobacter ginsenosidimutans TaxID=490573 RepID=A0A9X3MZY5_9ACTN|nr:hypothetical protein [Solirubrobacter ginsenosidimutans]MDA0164287.1 hypothetical protein [Solirubrobacter ginsenosidimutans]
MVDQLRILFNRPLQDGDRPRLFAIAVALIAASAGLFSLLDDAGPARALRREAPVSRPATAGSAAAIVPASTPVAPSEESDPPAGLRPAPADVTRSKRAARRFLAGYLRFSYGHGEAGQVRSASPQLRAELARSRPRVPSSERRRRPRIQLLQSNGVSRERADLLALVGDGARRYSVRLQLANTPTGWLVTGLER